MNIKHFILTLLLCLGLVVLTSLRITTSAAEPDAAQTAADETVTLVFSFEVRIRLPILEKDVI